MSIPPGRPLTGKPVASFSWAGTPGWFVRGTLGIVQGDLVISRLLVEPNIQGLDQVAGLVPSKLPPGGVTTTVLRHIPAGQIIAEAKAKLEDLANFEALRNQTEWQEVTELYVRSLGLPSPPSVRKLLTQITGQAPRKGRRGYSDDFYANVARLYLTLLAEGGGRGVLRRCSSALSKRAGREIPPETVRDWIHRARKKGFLTMGTPGKAGAAPGPRLIDWDVAKWEKESPQHHLATNEQTSNEVDLAATETLRHRGEGDRR